MGFDGDFSPSIVQLFHPIIPLGSENLRISSKFLLGQIFCSEVGPMSDFFGVFLWPSFFLLMGGLEVRVGLVFSFS